MNIFVRGDVALPLALTALCAVGLAFAQDVPPGDIQGQPWTGGPGLSERVSDIMARRSPDDAVRRLRPRQIKPRRPLELQLKRQHRDSPPLPGAPQSATPSPVKTSLAAPRVGVTFLAAQASDTPSVPPDTMGDVGPTQILVCLNDLIRTFTRAGVRDGILDTGTDNFFSSVRGKSGTTDPRVRFDRLSGRWFITMISLDTPNRILLAVSSGPTISSSSSFAFFQFQQDLVGPTPNPDTGDFADYDTLGVDARALYIGVDIYSPTDAFEGTTGFVVNKANLLAGTLTVTAFRRLAAATGSGPDSPQGVGNDDPAATEGYFIGADRSSFGLLVLRRVSNPGGTPSISGNLNVVVPSTSSPIHPTPMGSGTPLDALDDRLYEARIRNGRLWTAHNIQVDATGAADSKGGRDGARWYEIGTLSGTPTLIQSGTVYDSAAVTPRSFWMPSCAVSGQGHMMLGCSVAGAAEYAEIAVAGRLAGDPAGDLSAPIVAQASSTVYDYNDGSYPRRWGDYSVTTLDPNDNMTIWTIQEYCNAVNSWGVRVIQTKAPPPASPWTCVPATVPLGVAGTNILVTGMATNGLGFYDPGTGFASRLSAALTGAGVTVNQVSYLNPSNLTLNITVAGNAAAGGRSLIVTNPDGQTAPSVGNILILGDLWAGAAGMGNGWMWLSWFGYFTDLGGGWLYHLQHGYLYYPSDALSSSLWLHGADMGWLWTSPSVYPFLYRAQDGAWLWYLRGSSSPRWFHNYSTGLWESH